MAPRRVRNYAAELRRRAARWASCPYVSRSQVRGHPRAFEIPLSVPSRIARETARGATWEIDGPDDLGGGRLVCIVSVVKPNGERIVWRVPWEKMGNLFDVTDCLNVPQPDVFASGCAVAVATRDQSPRSTRRAMRVMQPETRADVRRERRRRR